MRIYVVVRQKTQVEDGHLLGGSVLVLRGGGEDCR